MAEMYFKIFAPLVLLANSAKSVYKGKAGYLSYAKAKQNEIANASFAWLLYIYETKLLFMFLRFHIDKQSQTASMSWLTTGDSFAVYLNVDVLLNPCHGFL